MSKLERNIRTDPRARVQRHHAEGAGVVRFGYPIGVRWAAVHDKRVLTPSMLRLTLRGAALRQVHSYHPDDHVALLFPDEAGRLTVPTARADGLLDWQRPRPRGRKYTIRRLDTDAGEMDLDMVRHGGGLAAQWAEDARSGDEIALAGPPGALAFPFHLPHYVCAVDLSALPAVARLLEMVPDTARVDIVCQVDDPADQAYPLPLRAGDTVQWVPSGDDTLAAALAQLTVGASTQLFAAGEAGALRPLRTPVADRPPASITGYWKRGTVGFDQE